MKRWLLIILVPLLALTGCGYNDFQRLDEQTKSAWSEVLNQYQRRADLVPNIVATVKGEANFEQETLTKVVEARAKATSMQVTPETLNNPEAFAKFQQAQGELSSALSRLMVVVRALPRPEGQPGLPRPAGAAGRHREPHHGGAQPLHPDGAGVQRAGAQLPDQPDGHGVRLQAQAQLHGAERSADLDAAAGRLRRPRSNAADAPPVIGARILLAACGAPLPGCAAGPAAQDVLPVPPLTARVVDQTGTLDAIQRKGLEDKLLAFEQTKGTQIAMLMVPTTQPEDIASYANRVANAWKIGRKDVGDGVLLVVAKDDRKVRIEVAKTLEGAIPDLAAKQIIDDAITPDFPQERLRRRACTPPSTS